MKKFADIQALAEQRKGGSKALKELLPRILPEKKLAQIPDDRFMAMITKVINQAGFNWTVIENKWPQFEEAFYGFNVNKLASLAPEQWEAYMQDTRVVRNWQNIKAVMNNVYMVREVIDQHGSFARFIADWPCSDQIGLMAYLKKHGSRLGGQSSQYFLRFIGKDGFVLSKDVIHALIDAGLEITEKPTSKRDLSRIQCAFNEWHEETGLPYCHLSKIASYSWGPNYKHEDIKQQMEKFTTANS